MKPLRPEAASRTDAGSGSGRADKPALVCHCFGYTAEDIATDVRLNGRSTILKRIAAAKRAGGCRCAEKNPSGH